MGVRRIAARRKRRRLLIVSNSLREAEDLEGCRTSWRKSVPRRLKRLHCECVTCGTAE
jgi:hypothetical protein